MRACTDFNPSTEECAKLTSRAISRSAKCNLTKTNDPRTRIAKQIRRNLKSVMLAGTLLVRKPTAASSGKESMASMASRADHKPGAGRFRSGVECLGVSTGAFSARMINQANPTFRGKSYQPPEEYKLKVPTKFCRYPPAAKTKYAPKTWA